VVQKVFELSGKESIAGLNVSEGKLKTDSKNPNRFVYRILRGKENQVVYDGLKEQEELEKLNRGSERGSGSGKGSGISLKRFKDTVEEVSNGMECGLTIPSFSHYQNGDTVECFRVEVEKQKIPRSMLSTSSK
jgi:translation initiation factor IF-2